MNWLILVHYLLIKTASDCTIDGMLASNSRWTREKTLVLMNCEKISPQDSSFGLASQEVSGKKERKKKRALDDSYCH